MNTQANALRGSGHPVWVAGFRPFYLLGAGYGVLLMLTWVAAYVGLWQPPYTLKLWHGHEMIFGFAGAIVSGFVLTALPGWAGTKELHGGPLKLLTAAWLAGRAAMWLAPSLPPALVVIADSAPFLILAALVTPDLLRVRNRYFLALLPILAGLFLGAVMFHLGDPAWGLRLGLYAVVGKFVLVGGFLTPVFTGNELRERGEGNRPRFNPVVEWLAIGTAVAFMVLDLAGAPAQVRGGAAALAAVVHAIRLARWQGWRVSGTPWLVAMHFAYGWLVAAFALAAAADLGGGVPAAAWLHAFTVGALGLMMLGLMSRVTLRHTGRPPALPAELVWAYWIMGAAAVARVVMALTGAVGVPMAVSALVWTVPFALYLKACGGMLLTPSLPPQRKP